MMLYAKPQENHAKLQNFAESGLHGDVRQFWSSLSCPFYVHTSMHLAAMIGLIRLKFRQSYCSGPEPFVPKPSIAAAVGLFHLEQIVYQQLLQ